MWGYVYQALCATFGISAVSVSFCEWIKFLYHLDSLEDAEDVMTCVIRDQKSHHAFDDEKRQWRFQIKSNKDHLHAIR